MKRMIKWIVASIIMLCWAQVGFCGQADGFRGMKWGDPPTKLGPAITVQNDGNIVAYERVNDKPSIGDAKLQHITYLFYKGQFTAAVIYFSGYHNYGDLFESTKANYGHEWQPNEYIKSYFWHDNPEVLVALEYSDATQKGTLVIESTKLMRQKKADEKARAAAAAKTDF